MIYIKFTVDSRLKKIISSNKKYSLQEASSILEKLEEHTKNNKSIESVKQIAKKFGIVHLLAKYPYELSGGEKQRTAICRAMVENPELILADEPTGNLDSNASLEVIKTLVHINKEQNKTIVMVTHDPKMASYGKKTLFLKDGVIVDTLVKKETNEKYYEKILNKMAQI